MTTLTIGAIQMDIILGKKDENIQKAKSLIGDAKGCDIIYLPELFTTGYALDDIKDLAEQVPGPTTDSLALMAREAGALIGATLAELDGGRIYNTHVIIDTKGNLVARYRKAHLFGPLHETDHFSPGSELVTADIKIAILGLMTCYDIRFPEQARKLTLDGAHILTCPSEFPKPRLSHWRNLLLARAIENQVFVVAVNRVGSDTQADYFGHSMIIDPWGEVLAEAGEEEEVITAEVDIKTIEEVRGRIPVLKDRRLDLY
jgi:predicted amidohydrolase